MGSKSREKTHVISIYGNTQIYIQIFDRKDIWLNVHLKLLPLTLVKPSFRKWFSKKDK
jgi:hypothetical protein